jgi:hypothetical protein
MKSRNLLVLAAVLAVGTLGGCAMSAGSGVTPTEARERFTAVLDSTQGVLGGRWENRDDPTVRSCTIPLWVDGVSYPGLRLGKAPDSPDSAINTVEEHWQTLEVSAQRNEIGDVTELRGTNPSGDLFIFRANGERLTLQGESECRPES